MAVWDFRIFLFELRGYLISVFTFYTNNPLPFKLVLNFPFYFNPVKQAGIKMTVWDFYTYTTAILLGCHWP